MTTSNEKKTNQKFKQPVHSSNRMPLYRLQIVIPAGQMYPGNAQKLLEAYKETISTLYGSLVLHLKETIPESISIFEPYIRAQEDSIRTLTADRQGVRRFQSAL